MQTHVGKGKRVIKNPLLSFFFCYFYRQRKRPFAEKRICVIFTGGEGQKRAKKCVHILLDKIFVSKVSFVLCCLFLNVHFFYYAILLPSSYTSNLGHYLCAHHCGLFTKYTNKTKMYCQYKQNICEMNANYPRKTLLGYLAICTSHSYVETNKKKTQFAKCFIFDFFFSLLIHSFSLCFVLFFHKFLSVIVL